MRKLFSLAFHARRAFYPNDAGEINASWSFYATCLMLLYVPLLVYPTCLYLTNSNFSFNKYVALWLWLMLCAINYFLVMAGDKWQAVLAAYPMPVLSKQQVYWTLAAFYLVTQLIIFFPIGGKDWISTFGHVNWQRLSGK